MNRIRPYLIKAILPSLLVLLWILISSNESAPVYFPSIISIVQELVSLLQEAYYIEHLYTTALRCFIGFFIAITLAIPLGIVLGSFKNIYRLFHFIIEFLRPLPSAAVIPIAILFLGIDNSMKVFVIVFGSLWPVLINTLDGVLNIEPQYLKTAKAFHVSSSKTLLRIVFPSILPQIFSGMKVSIAISLILAITVEMIVGGDGLGFFILDAERSFQFKQMYAGVFSIGLLGYIVNLVFLSFEKWILFWKN